MKFNLNLTALTVPEEEMSLFKELWLYFYETYMYPERVYENLGLDRASLLSLSLLIFGLCIGASLAAFGAVFNKRVLGSSVRKLLSLNALSPDTALTLEEIGAEQSVITRLAVKRSTSLRRVVKCREEEEYNAMLEKKRQEYEEKRRADKKLPKFKEAPYKLDTLASHFYIPEKMKYTAELKFEQKGSTWISAIVFTVVMAVVFVALLAVMPNILELLNDIAGSIDTSPNNII